MLAGVVAFLFAFVRIFRSILAVADLAGVKVCTAVRTNPAFHTLTSLSDDQ